MLPWGLLGSWALRRRLWMGPLLEWIWMLGASCPTASAVELGDGPGGLVGLAGLHVFSFIAALAL
eukprot:13656802-Alexandrium_andersonii.AAC.1